MRIPDPANFSFEYKKQERSHISWPTQINAIFGEWDLEIVQVKVAANHVHFTKGFAVIVKLKKQYLFTANDEQ